MTFRKLFLFIACICMAQHFFAQSYVNGEVMVKFKNSSSVTVRKSTKGRFLSSSVSAVDKVLQEMGVTEVQQLMPLSGKKVTTVVRRAISSQRTVGDADLSQLYVARFDSTKFSVGDAMAKLKELDDVECVEPNYIFRTCSTTEAFDPTAINDPLYTEAQWNISAINLDKLWQMPVNADSTGTLGKRPVIAILDTGVDTTHPDLKDNLWTGYSGDNGNLSEEDDGYVYYQMIHGWDFITDNPIIYQTNDANGHGTHCAGIAAAVGGNGIGIVGANPDAQIMAVKVLNDVGTGTSSSILRGIDFAIEKGATVLSMSFSGGGGGMILQALQKAYVQGIMPVAAAGNKGQSIYNGGLSFPAAYDICVGVVASNEDGSRSNFSNYDPDGPFNTTYIEGYNYDVLAPGIDIMSTWPGGSYKSLSGTSMACPLVAGAISRMQQIKGFDFTKSYSFIGDMAMSKVEGNDVFDAVKAISWTADQRKASVRIIGTRIDDSEAGNGDGVIDAGETVVIYPTITNMWGKAENVTVHARLFNTDVADDNFQILSNDVSFGYTVDSRGVMEGANGIRIKVGDGIKDGFILPVYFSLTCDNDMDADNRQDFEQEYTISNCVELGGLYTEDVVLSPDVNYVVTKTMLLDKCVKFTVLPGAVVHFKSGTGIISHYYYLQAGYYSGGDSCYDVHGTEEAPIRFISEGSSSLSFIGNHSLMSYVVFDGFSCNGNTAREFYRCTFKNCSIDGGSKRECLIVNSSSRYSGFDLGKLVNCTVSNCSASIYSHSSSCTSGDVDSCNYVDNMVYGGINRRFTAIALSGNQSTYRFNTPCYFGSSDIEYVKQQAVDANTPEVGWGATTLDLSEILTAPSKEAPGIVWKVLVDGYDAQDQYDHMPPLGVGKHKFEVYFSRPMKKAYTPQVSMGVRDPYTQTVIDEDGVWNEDSTIYTVYHEITARNAIYGINTIRVAGCKEARNFDVPVENYRFHVNIQPTGSMSTAMYAEPGIGKVKLNWDTDAEDLYDLMGYNLYRYTISDGVSSDTVMVNSQLIEPDEVTYTDYDVEPGITYYYIIKQITTAFEEYLVSNAVEATPLSTVKGDCNGSASVDIADVIADVSYMTFQNPKPFVFSAADVDGSGEIDILDVMTTVNMILYPEKYTTESTIDEPAVCRLVDGVLEIESPVTVGGIQICADTEITPLDALNGFEIVSRQPELGTNAILLAYSMNGKSLDPGKHNIVNVGSGNIKSIVLSDVSGRNIPVVLEGTATDITEIASGHENTSKIYDLTGRRINKVQKGIYIKNSKKYLQR